MIVSRTNNIFNLTQPPRRTRLSVYFFLDSMIAPRKSSVHIIIIVALVLYVEMRKSKCVIIPFLMLTK